MNIRLNICRARMKATKPLGLAGNKSEYFTNETQFAKRVQRGCKGLVRDT